MPQLALPSNVPHLLRDPGRLRQGTRTRRARKNGFRGTSQVGSPGCRLRRRRRICHGSNVESAGVGRKRVRERGGACAKTRRRSCVCSPLASLTVHSGLAAAVSALWPFFLCGSYTDLSLVSRVLAFCGDFLEYYQSSTSLQKSQGTRQPSDLPKIALQRLPPPLPSHQRTGRSRAPSPSPRLASPRSLAQTHRHASQEPIYLERNKVEQEKKTTHP